MATDFNGGRLDTELRFITLAERQLTLQDIELINKATSLGGVARIKKRGNKNEKDFIDNSNNFRFNIIFSGYVCARWCSSNASYKPIAKGFQCAFHCYILTVLFSDISS